MPTLFEILQFVAKDEPVTNNTMARALLVQEFLQTGKVPSDDEFYSRLETKQTLPSEIGAKFDKETIKLVLLRQ